MTGEINGSLEPMDTSLQSTSPNSTINQNDNDNKISSNSNTLKVEKEQSDEKVMYSTDNILKAQVQLVPHNETSNNINSDNQNSNSHDSYMDTQEYIKELDQSTIPNQQNKNVDSKQDFGNALTNDEESDEEMDSEEDSSDDEESDGSSEPKAGDSVSLNTDSEEDTTQDSQINKNTESEVVILDSEKRQNLNGNRNCASQSPEIHEIVSDNDDCIVTSDDKSNSGLERPRHPPSNVHHSRNIEMGTHSNEEIESEDESDIEEITIQDPLTQHNEKNNTIFIKNTNALVDIAAKQTKNAQGNKNDPTVVIIDTNSILTSKNSAQQNKNTMSAGNKPMHSHSSYQKMDAKGTTFTPVYNGKSAVPSANQNSPQLPILPSLTDDMFVVEAPSFIVPYVYEKPSIKPFREFVDNLGKEIEEQCAKEEKEIKDKKEKLLKEKKEKGELEEEVKEDEEKEEKMETDAVEEDKKKTKKDRKKIKGDGDDDSWDGESSEESDDDIISDEEGTTVIIKDKVDCIDEIKGTVNALATSKVAGIKSDNYFDCSLGKFFTNIGLSMVQGYVQNDLLKLQNRKLNKEKKSGVNTKATQVAVASLMKNIELSKENNAPYMFPQKKCEFCSFKSESMMVLSHHLETPHMKNNVYKCNFCTFEIRSPHDILYHMEAEHNIRGRLERAPAYHQCANCIFEDNGKGKLARHLISCGKKFKPDYNLAPSVEWEPPAKIPKIARSRNSIMPHYQSQFNRAPIGRPPMNVANLMPNTVNNFRSRARNPLSVSPRGSPLTGTPVMMGGLMVRHNSPNSVLLPNNYPIQNNQGKIGSKMLHQPSISITPLPRPQNQQQLPPVASQSQASHSTKGTFVICEICDGYIKDLEQLRNHMQWIHKVKIHPKMIYNRPPLNCQKCQFRFFTDQGLERHLLGSHGLVTSSMQDAANKGKDAGRCPVCGRVYQWKLLNHVAKDHLLTLKPAHLSYKCTVCTATFGMYKQFENHVYSAHSVVAKRVMDKSKTTTTSPASKESLLKPLKINDEITIIPQPAKPLASNKK